MKFAKKYLSGFSLSQMVENTRTGKTSGSGTAGVYIVFFSVIAFLYGCWEFHYSGKNDILFYSTANIAVGAGLLGFRKSSDVVLNAPETPIEEVPPVEPLPQEQL